jgi:hypothetical protein
MQQRQLRLGDILDDYCPRERRVTNHAVVAMVGSDVKLTRCATCDADHEYKHAKVPRQRRKDGAPPTLYSQVLAGAPKRVGRGAPPEEMPVEPAAEPTAEREAPEVTAPAAGVPSAIESGSEREEEGEHEPTDAGEEGPVHRPLIRATLPRVEGQPPPTRPAPEFTIRQPGGRQNRFRQGRRGTQSFHSPSGNFGGHPPRAGMPCQGGGRPPVAARLARRQRPGHKRSK